MTTLELESTSLPHTVSARGPHTHTRETRAPGRPRTAPGAPVHRCEHWSISEVEAANLSAALNYSRTLDAEPNLFVTIQWLLTASSVRTPERIQLVIKRMGAWCRRHGVPVVWAYVREIGARKGEHLHLAVFVPLRLRKAFFGALEGWVQHDCKEPIPRKTIDTRPITFGLNTWLKRYLLKNGTDAVRNLYGVSRKHKRTEGITMGRRVRVSRSIDAGARANAGGAFNPKATYADE